MRDLHHDELSKVSAGSDTSGNSCLAPYFPYPVSEQVEININFSISIKGRPEDIKTLFM